MTTNVLQPLNINGSDPNFFNNFCGACLNVTNADGNLRGQATEFIEQTKRQEGCIPAVLQIATDSEVSVQLQICRNYLVNAGKTRKFRICPKLTSNYVYR